MSFLSLRWSRFPWWLVLGLTGGFGAAVLAMGVLRLPGVVVMILAVGVLAGIAIEHATYAVTRAWAARTAPPPSVSPTPPPASTPPPFPLPPPPRHRQ